MNSCVHNLTWTHFRSLLQVPDEDIARYSVLHDNNRMITPLSGGEENNRRICDAMPIGKPQVVVWLVPSAPFRALFLILNEDRNEYINEHINDTVTAELSLRSGTRFTGKSRVDRNRMVGVY